MKKKRNKRNEDQEKGNDEPFSNIKANVRQKMKSHSKLVQPFSTFQSTPLVVASKIFTFLPLSNSLNADGFKNQFLLNAAVKYLETYEDIGVTGRAF